MDLFLTLASIKTDKKYNRNASFRIFLSFFSLKYGEILRPCRKSINLNKFFKILTNLIKFHIVNISQILDKIQIIQYLIPRSVYCETKLVDTKSIHFYCSN
jgi:hypothetical protein